MKRNSSTTKRNLEVWQRVIQLQADLSPGAAQALLGLQFSERDHARMDELSEKARAGALYAAEKAELDDYERLGCVLDVIHSNARRILKKRPKKAS